MGKFRVCSQFMKKEACGVGESYCSFAHGNEEVHFWEMDRYNQFSIEDFIERMRQYVFGGKDKSRSDTMPLVAILRHHKIDYHITTCLYLMMIYYRLIMSAAFSIK